MRSFVSLPPGAGATLRASTPAREPALPFRLLLRAAFLSALLVLSGIGSAQLLAEVATVAAASAQLDPAIRLPSGSFRATAQVPPGLINRIEGRGAYRDWEAYTARGLAGRLFPAHVQQLANSFAVAGYFQQSRSERRVGNEKHTSQVFVGDGGGIILLYVIETSDELVWLIARGN
jgi:hypothetical protein